MALPARKKKFTAGKDWVWYAPNGMDGYGETEIAAVQKALKNGWLTTGPVAKKFEQAIAELYGKKLGLFVNSGSSANLLALEALNFPKGAEIITPACNFNTTVAPVVQKGLVPVFVDVKEGFYNIDPAALEKALSKKTVAIMAPHLIGNLADLHSVRRFAKKHKLVLIEDSCDTIGSTYRGRKTGTYSDITTTSFYASHLITTGGAGGMIMVNDKKLRERLRVFRDWGRGISRHDEKIRSRLATFTIAGKPYDSAFVFVERGYNMRPTEMQAAFGLAQLARLPEFSSARRRNYNTLRTFFKKYEKHFILPQTEKGAKVNWLAYPVTLRKGSGIERNTLARYLEDHKIQTRPLFSGNITKHPTYRNIGRIAGSLTNSDHILRNSLLIGLHHGITPSMLAYVCDTLESFMRKYI